MRDRRELLGLAAACLLAGCGGSGPARVASPSPSPGPSVRPAQAYRVTSSGNGRYTTLTEMKDRRILYSVRARSFVARSNGGLQAVSAGVFEQPHIVFHDRGGATTVADAPKAVFTSADKSVTMTGGVVARTSDGDTLHCDRLTYNGRTERLHGSGHVVLQAPDGLVLSGDTLDGDAQLDDVVVQRR